MQIMQLSYACVLDMELILFIYFFFFWGGEGGGGGGRGCFITALVFNMLKSCFNRRMAENGFAPPP